MRIVSLALLGCFMFVGTPVFAKVVTFEREYTYQAGEADSKLSCRAIALEEVKRLLLEEMGTYLKSETAVKNLEITKDQITTMTAGIVSTVIVDEKWDGVNYVLTAKMQADPDQVAEAVNALSRGLDDDIELEETRQKAEEALKEVERLKKELALAKEKSTADELKKQYAKASNELGAMDFFEKGHALWLTGNYREAINAFDQAIDLHPGFAKAFLNRGAAYRKLSEYQKAIKDLDRAIDLNPKLAKAYLNRGTAYRKIDEYEKAINDLDTAIAIHPRLPQAYLNRGITYRKLEKYRKAIKDFNRAIKLNPDYHKAYFHRAITWKELGWKERFIDDLKRAASLGSERAQDILNRIKETTW